MPKPTPEPYLHLAELILRRYRSTAHKSLADVYRLDRDFLGVEGDSLEFLLTERESLLQALDDPARFEALVGLFVDASLRFTYQNNQFVHLDRAETDILTGLYRAYLRDLQGVLRSSSSLEALEASLSTVVRAHFQDLSANLARFFDAELTQQIQDNLILQQAVCGEYSPELQLAILGLDPPSLAQPVLDLGCGRSGRLVAFLRERGVQAYGVDRAVDRADFLSAGDWFDLELRPNTWGMVISHMAFSNHFLFHHRYKHGDPHRYARRYMEILGALRPGGAFVYAPGLPFIEQFLPPRYFRVEQRALGDLPQFAHLDTLEEETWYTTRVVKL